MRDQTEIQDLYEGAFLLCCGFCLKDFKITNTYGKKIVTFILAGEKIENARSEYRSGTASCNVLLLKISMDKLKDLMFQSIRKIEDTRHVRKII